MYLCITIVITLMYVYKCLSIPHQQCVGSTPYITPPTLYNTLPFYSRTQWSKLLAAWSYAGHDSVLLVRVSATKERRQEEQLVPQQYYCSSGQLSTCPSGPHPSPR